MSEPTSIHARLRAIRRAAGLTQAALADRLESTPKRIANIERGTRRANLDLIGQWAEACGRRFEFAFVSEAATDPEVASAMEALATAQPELRRAVLLILDSAADVNGPALAALEGHVKAWTQSLAKGGTRRREAP